MKLNLALLFNFKYFAVCFKNYLSLVIAHGINAGDVRKLQDAGIYTCNGLMMQTKKVSSNFDFEFEFW